MNRLSLLYKLDELQESCKGCKKREQINKGISPEKVCKGCQTYSQIRWIGENLGRKKEMAKITLEQYQDLKTNGLSDKEIAQNLEMNPQYLSQLKKKWDIRPVLGVTAEKKPSETYTIKEHKTSSYDALMKELQYKLTDAQADILEKQKLIHELQAKIEKYEHIESACEDVESELDNLREENEKLKKDKHHDSYIIENQKYQLGQYAKENGELQEENKALKFFAKKYLVEA